MPKRKDIKSILLIGSGPIVIGQACEFDYSGTQACKALREEGYKTILVNSNPATIMTDPEMADSTYIEPLDSEALEKIIAKERPDALLPTIGGQTGLNIAIDLHEKGILQKYNVELIGANVNAIKKAEDRNLFKKAMKNINLDIPASGYVTTEEGAMEVIKEIGFPAIIRPSFTLGGTGGNVAYNMEEYVEHVRWGLAASPFSQILIEESLIGWKEFELEVMRDSKDNVVIICPIENFDPMGIHTGDSITVAPAQTLTDKEYQILRDASIKIIREIGVDTGGSNIQFAVNPKDGRMMVIEMNPRVSRSSALASKATGFPIAKIAAKLAVGFTLDEIANDITKKTPASFEPTIDYCVVKIPRFTFEKFPQADQTLTTQMKSVGEVMSIGRNFKEALQKAVRSLEIDIKSLEIYDEAKSLSDEMIKKRIQSTNWQRLWFIAEALRRNISVKEINTLSSIDPWFINNIKEIIEFESLLKKSLSAYRNEVNILLSCCEDSSKGCSQEKPAKNTIDEISSLLRKAKQLGFSDEYIASILKVEQIMFRKLRKHLGVEATYKMVDTCAAEFEAYTPYLYSTYESECEANPTNREKIIILGGGPNRIGQGIEFDYCCVHAALALKEDGFETIMVNCNPETVSTDYDTSDRLYFEPLTLEEVLNIIEKENPLGVIVQFGGQTPLKLSTQLKKNGVRILGTSPENIDIAENREKFKVLITRLNLLQPPNGTAMTLEQAINEAEKIGYPVLLRPSYVLGGRAMEIVYDKGHLERYMKFALRVSPEHPILIDKFLEDAIEVDVDAICDGKVCIIAGVMEHIEEAGIHSGDSACSLPPYSISKELIEEIKVQTRALAFELNVIGLINIQFAIKDQNVYILEVNPRASRTIPFVSKAIGIPFAKLAARAMAGKTLQEMGLISETHVSHISVKEAVFPFIKFPGVDTILGPEMKSTGEVMGIDQNFGRAFYKSQLAAGTKLPKTGTVFISVKDKDKELVIPIAQKLSLLGFNIIATTGTHNTLAANGVKSTLVNKVKEGRPHIVDILKDGKIDMVINTSFGKETVEDSYTLRRTTLIKNIPYCTTIAGAVAAVTGIESFFSGSLDVTSLQEYYRHDK
ncbi:MAG: carbamoyl-phosphate synthase large subunit [Candidatus Schekmanbacteria bacterium]|nr:carbamoyl-phosphate synthase large subunit [Candidatus Schekmanbacteria bacterium]